jgi:hypothetical protein
MKRMRFSLILIGFLLLGSVIHNKPAQAESGSISPSISVNPGLVRESIKPGATKEVLVTLTNLGKDAIPLGVSSLNITRISDQGAPEFTNQITPRSANDWLVANKTDLILDPSGSQQLTVKISPPVDTAPGGYSGVLVFQAKLPSYYFDLDANTRILPALSTSFLISISPENGAATPKLQIKTFDAPKIVISGPIPLVAELTNPSNFFIFADGDLTIEPTFGDRKNVTKLNGSVLMPDSSRKYVSAYSGRILPGIYNARLELKQGDTVLVASARFFALPWPFIAGLIVLALTVFILLARRRIKRVLAALAGHEAPKKPSRPVLR